MQSFLKGDLVFSEYFPFSRVYILAITFGVYINEKTKSLC